MSLIFSKAQHPLSTLDLFSFSLGLTILIIPSPIKMYCIGPNAGLTGNRGKEMMEKKCKKKSTNYLKQLMM